MSEVYSRLAKFDGKCARCGIEIRRRTICWLAPSSDASWVMSCYPTCDAVKSTQEAYTLKCGPRPPKTDLSSAFKKYPLPWDKA